MTALFQRGDFRLHSHGLSEWKVECDTLNFDDWCCLADRAVEILPDFGSVEGVPRGGEILASLLQGRRTDGGPLLIVDDVLTTGTSMEAHRDGRAALGLVVFARGPMPSWIRAIWRFDG